MSEELDKVLVREVGQVHLHVGDGGVTFTVLDDSKRGPVVEIHTSVLGNLTQTLRVFTTDEGLVALAKLFTVASKRDYAPPYCYAASTNGDFQEVPDSEDGLPTLTVTYPPPSEVHALGKG